MTPQEKLARRIRRHLYAITGALEELENIDPIYRFRHLATAVDDLENAAGEARRRRAGNILDLRNPGLTNGVPRAPLGWQTIADLVDRDVNYQAIQQWAKQYKAAEPADS